MMHTAPHYVIKTSNITRVEIKKIARCVGRVHHNIESTIVRPMTLPSKKGNMEIALEHPPYLSY